MLIWAFFCLCVYVTGTEKLISRAELNGHHEQTVRMLMEEAPAKIYYYEGLEELLQEAHEQDNGELDVHIASVKPTPLSTMADDLAHQLRCKVCLENQSNVFLRMCGHLVCCSVCARNLRNCPVCRAPIVGKKIAYF